MPRSKEQNKIIRDGKIDQILDTALSQYVMYGYNGTDMDTIAESAEVSKGLLYYYFKTKNVLFKELFNIMMAKTSSYSDNFFNKVEGMNPVDKLVKYSLGIFGMGFEDPRYIQFAMRMPFDAFAVFGANGWREGLEGSKKHNSNLEKIITEGMDNGYMRCTNAKEGANSFWTVYVAALFNFTKMTGSKSNKLNKAGYEEGLENLLAFGMSGLGVDEALWKKSLAKCIREETNESI